MLLRIIVGVFMVLHGLVHLLYTGHSLRYFELSPGLVWPDGSLLFSKLLGNEATRWLAAIACVLAALGFVASGAAILFQQAWWRPAIVGSAILSSLIYLLLWDGALKDLSGKGLIAILINAVILVAVLVVHWPDFDF